MRTNNFLPSFSHRYINATDTGAIFHQFVRELFAQVYEGLASAEMPGKDGAIDLWHDSGIVWECKFVGSDGETGVRNAWNKTHENLSNNLGKPQAHDSLYAPWLNQQEPIKQYIFCTSTVMKTSQAVRKLEQDITSAFAAIADKSNLPHLKKIKVRVWSWERLAPSLARFPHLRLRWFPERLPSCFRALDKWLVSYQLGFRAYLREEKLAYVPLQEYDLAPPRLLQRLGETPYKITVLSGVGGAGKSRLLAETAAQAQREQWLVLMADAATLSPQAITELLREIDAQPVLIGIDYLEKCLAFEQVVNAVVMANSSGKQVHLLATCRESARASLDNYAHFLQNISLAKIDQAEVVRKMLSPELLEYQTECRAVPVFAAFVRFLHASKQFAALQELRQETDFIHWLIKHLLRMGGVQENNLPVLEQAAVMLILPASEQQLQSLRHNKPALIPWLDALEQDEWLQSSDEETGTQWQAAHDVLIDGSLLYGVERQTDAQLFVMRLMAYAQEYAGMQSALENLQRISHETGLQKVDWLKICMPHQQSLRPFLDHALKLMDFSQALAFLQCYQGEMAQIVQSDFMQGLFGAMARSCWKKTLELKEVQQQQLAQWLDAAVLSMNTYNFVLTHALRWQAKRYWAQALAWLRQQPAEFQSHYLLVACIKHAEEAKDLALANQVAPFVKEWLAHFAKIPHATYVIAAWLDATKNGDVVEDALSKWLAEKRNCLSPEAHFIFKAWLDAKQDAGLIKEAVCKWLKEESNCLSPEAHFVFKAWLGAKQDASLIQEAVCKWLKEERNCLSPEASFVFSAWLNAKQDASLIQEAVCKWLKEESNCLSLEASFVFPAWLDAKQDAGLIQEAVCKWLKEESNCLSLEASFVFPAWLDAKQDAGLIQEAVCKWLKEESNCLSPEARFVFQAWLNAQLDLPTIEDAVNRWLAHARNASDVGADFVYRAYGDRLKFLNPTMFAYACLWLQAQQANEDAAYCMKFIAGDQRLDTPTAYAILAWLAKFPHSIDAPSRLGRLRPASLKQIPVEYVCATYQSVLAAHMPRVAQMSNWETLIVMYAFLNAARLSNPQNLQVPARLPIALLFCKFLSVVNQQHMGKINFLRMVGGSLPGLLHLGLKNGAALTPQLKASIILLEQKYLGLHELGSKDATALAEIRRRVGF